MVTLFSTEYTAIYRTSPANTGIHRSARGHKRVEEFNFTQPVSPAGTDPQTIFMVKVPGSSRISLSELYLEFGIWDASTVLDVGWAAYRKTDNSQVAADPNGLIAGLDISGTAVGVLWGLTRYEAAATLVLTSTIAPVGRTFEFDSMEPVDITFTTSGGGVPTAALTLNGYVTYVE